jgi:hypothetical protein
VPAQQRLGLDEEARPSRPRQQATDRGEEGPVAGLEPGTWGLAVQDRKLVAQHQDLQFLGSIAAGDLDGTA